jgi:Ca2+-binding RTX toxin-like protein
MAAPAPSPTVNTLVLSDDGVYNFSDFADNVALNNFPEALGKPIRMWGGNDFVTGSSTESPGWDNQVNGNLGSDNMNGGSLRDKYLGGKEADGLAGNNGQDWVNGNNGNDFVFGGADNDIVRGGQNNDQLFGDAGNDILIGDFGRDFLSGNGGFDRFILRTDSATVDGVFLKNTSPNSTEVDVIVDFSAAPGSNDKIVIPGVTSFANLAFSNTTIDGVGGTLISDALGERIGFVRNISVVNLTAGGGANFVLGATADNFLQKASDPTFFLQNPNMATDLIPV